MEDEGATHVQCACCGNVSFDESDGFFYCQECGSLVDDILLFKDRATRHVLCRTCGHVGFYESDGFFYCQECGAAEADDIILNGVAD